MILVMTYLGEIAPGRLPPARREPIELATRSSNAHSTSRRKSPGQESGATLTRRSDGYNEKSCAAD
jgi:hypothetical protein